jgi:condensin complex subunit 3
MFHLIRLALQKRLRDKEPSVRVQAVLGLGPLAGNGDEESDEEDSDDDAAGGILFKLLDIMQNDPSADVRRTVLMNLPFQPITIKYLLERARDIDPATRRALYGKLLPVLGDFRHMSLVEREKLIRWGLRDRDEGVRKAAANLFRERWIEDCAKTASTATEEELKPGEAAAPNMEALLELLERIDVTHSGVEEGIAHQAMKEFWEGRPDYIKHITFDDDFWNDLTPESAFVVRSLNDYSIQADDDRVSGIVEEKMPEVTKIAFFIQQNLNRLIEGRNRIAQLGDDVTADIEEAYEAQEFIVEQLLHIAATLDYTDEVGRRQIFTIMREALSFAELPEECTKLAVEVLRTVCGSRESGEKEFCSVVLEAVAEVRDTLLPDDATEKGEDADESFHSAQSDISDLSNVGAKPKSHKTNIDDLDPAATEEKRVQEVYVYAKCLHIAECMLQNIHNELEANSALVTMLNTLIVPACRSHEAWIREMGLKCLGLCALLSKVCIPLQLCMLHRHTNSAPRILPPTILNCSSTVSLKATILSK